MTTNLIVRKNLLFLTGTTSAGFMSLWCLNHPDPVLRGLPMWSNICSLCCEGLNCFLSKVPAFLFCDVSLTLCSQFKDLHLLPLDKGNTPDLQQHGEAALRIVWHYHAVLNVGWLFRETPATPSRNISMMSTLSENSAHINLQKIHHPNSIENTKTKNKGKLVHFSPLNSTIWLFFLIYLSIWFFIWQQNNLGSDPYRKSSEWFKGLILLQEGNSLMFTACCKRAACSIQGQWSRELTSCI